MTERTAKLLVLALFVLVSGCVLWWAIKQLRLYWEWLEFRSVESLGLIVVGSFGLTALFIPFVVSNRWKELSPKDLATFYVAAFGLMFVVLTAVFLVLWILGFFLLLLRRYPIILVTLVALIVLLPPIIRRIRVFLAG